MAKDTSLDRLLDGFKDCLNDLWTLEVNTMVVSDIGGFKFNPYSGYEKIVSLPRTKREFHACLPWNEYNELFRKCQAELDPQIPDDLRALSEIEYLRKSIANELLLGDKARMLPSYVRASFSRKLRLPESPESVNKTIQSYVVLRQRLSRWYKTLTGGDGQSDNSMPKADISNGEAGQARREEQNPVAARGLISLDPTETVDEADRLKQAEQAAEQAEVRERDPGPLPSLDQAAEEGLFDNGAFLRELRSLRELFYLIGGEDATDSKNVHDLIFAQTIIEMDGDVMNRFHEQLLASPDREFLLSTHREAVSTGQENWQHLVTMIINTVKTLQNLLGL
jgi:hypothetical protein